MQSSTLAALAPLMLFPVLAYADAFDRVKCDGDVAETLRGVPLEVGKRKVVQLEAAHTAIKLKLDGADGIAGDPYGTRFWKICDREYVTLHDTHTRKTEDVVRDVLAVPTHPEIQRLLPPSRCTRGAATLDDVLALMPKGAEAKPAAAWRIDRAKLTFVSVPVEGLVCSAE